MGIKIVLALWVVMRTELIIENKLGECQVLVQKVLAFLIQIYFAKYICNASLLTFRVAAYENVFLYSYESDIFKLKQLNFRT